MVRSLLSRRRNKSAADVSSILDALPNPIFTVDETGRICYANMASEQFFEIGRARLSEMKLTDLVPADSPLFRLLETIRVERSSLSEYGVALETPRLGRRLVTVELSPIGDGNEEVVVALIEGSIAQRLDRQLTHRNAARSVTAMAQILAHEVKNPLSGIRGAAQLLEQSAGPEDRPLTQLICEETDRIVALVDRIEAFSDNRPIDKGPVNIHEVLEHVRRLAETGIARDITFTERYDPSLPPVFGNRDLLIQVFLNLVKNAAEAQGSIRGRKKEIILSTAYRHGIRLALPGTEKRTHLPLVVTVEDRGEGIPDDLRPHLFDAFVTTKANGKGLGLAFVAKAIDSHGGIIEIEGLEVGTAVRVMLPMQPLGGAKT